MDPVLESHAISSPVASFPQSDIVLSPGMRFGAVWVPSDHLGSEVWQTLVPRSLILPFSRDPTPFLAVNYYTPTLITKILVSKLIVMAMKNNFRSIKKMGFKSVIFILLKFLAPNT